MKIKFFFQGALTNVPPKQLPDIPSNSLMVWGGAGLSLVALAAPLVGMKSEVLQNASGMSFERWGVLLGLALFLTLTHYIILVALKMGTPPHVVSMVKTLLWQYKIK